jgi:poly(A) polymerase
MTKPATAAAATGQDAVEPSVLERSEHPISRRDIDPNVLRVLYRLADAGHVAYLVGGSVRDLIMGRRPKDFDVATSAHPHQVRDLFRNSRLIGRRFRLVHVFFGSQNIEVATFRQRSEDVDGSGDPMIRHDNTFGTPAEDAFRRDFTINSLFYDPRTFHVIDYAGGVPDLRARLIRTIGDPELRMREDPVRMLRAVRFAAKLGFDIEPATLAATERHCADLAKASVPRLVEETFRTLDFAGAERALLLMARLGLLEIVLPQLAHHLSAHGVSAHEGPLETTRTVRHLAAMGEKIRAGVELDRPFILACLFADFHLATLRQAGTEHRFDLIGALRARGFSRADTEHMRLLLEALTHLITPSRLTRRLQRRPYFSYARSLFDLVGSSYVADPGALDRFLGQAPTHEPRSIRQRRGTRRGRPRPASGDSAAPLATSSLAGNVPSGVIAADAPPAEVGDVSQPAPSRRRRRRGGRRRRRQGGLAGDSLTPEREAGAAIGEPSTDPPRDNSETGGPLRAAADSEHPR